MATKGRKPKVEKDYQKKRLKMLAMDIQQNPMKGTGPGQKAYTFKELQIKLAQYFINSAKTNTGLTISGLALWLGVTRRTLNNRKDDPLFGSVVGVALTKVENFYELLLQKRGNSGDIFALKNLGWTDKQEIETTNKNLNINFDITDADLQQKLADALSKK